MEALGLGIVLGAAVLVALPKDFGSGAQTQAGPSQAAAAATSEEAEAEAAPTPAAAAPAPATQEPNAPPCDGASSDEARASEEEQWADPTEHLRRRRAKLREAGVDLDRIRTLLERSRKESESTAQIERVLSALLKLLLLAAAALGIVIVLRTHKTTIQAWFPKEARVLLG